MYPYEIFMGLGMYEILLVIGFFLGLLYFRVFADRAKMGADLQNLCILCSLSALIGGYGCSVLTQAVYNALEEGHFQIAKNTGATFYGGLIGGAGIFILIYFAVGHFRPGKEIVKTQFGAVTDIVAGGVALAHSFGRIGCLFAGCCHGKVTTAWYGVFNAYLGQKTVPIQLFEAIFLLALCGFLSWRLIRGKKGNLAVYLAVYAVWRFIIEFFRADDRGATIVPFLSPSQFTAILLFLTGTLLWIFIARADRKKGSADEA